MKISQLFENIDLMEAIEENGNGLVAYCIVVAEEYTKMPAMDPNALDLWLRVITHNEKMLKRILKSVDIEFTDEDPYRTQKDMMYDIIKNKRLKIFKTPNDDAHPGMSARDNDIFRAVHDFLGHHLPNVKDFTQFLSKNKNMTKDDEAYKQFRFARNNFTVRGEMNTYISHGKLLPEELRPVLFTEIVGQICTYFVTGNYTVNKVGVMKGIDFKRIGLFTDSELSKRKEEYRKLLDDDSVKEFKTQLGTFNKETIKWNLLSRGEGQKNKRP